MSSLASSGTEQHQECPWLGRDASLENSTAERPQEQNANTSAVLRMALWVQHNLNFWNITVKD